QAGLLQGGLGGGSASKRDRLPPHARARNPETVEGRTPTHRRLRTILSPLRGALAYASIRVGRTDRPRPRTSAVPHVLRARSVQVPPKCSGHRVHGSRI